ncbi:MAG TPA: DUF378 domain-containing protein [Candidatus Paceibacterota bacterium]
MKGIHTLTFILLIVGGLNWGLEAFGWGIGNFLSPSVSQIVYILVGLSALVEIFTHKSNCRCCDTKNVSAPM